MLFNKSNKLYYQYDGETVEIAPWNKDSFRIRATMKPEMPDKDWALLSNINIEDGIDISITPQMGIISNGRIRAEISHFGHLMIYSNEKLILDEYLRNFAPNFEAPYNAPIFLNAREFKPRIGGDYELSLRLRSLSRTEKIYGMGQYQQEILNLKGAELELAQRNSQASVPFMVSTLGYGLLWNNPSVGRVSFGTNITTWYASSTDVMDYWITAADTPREILQNYAKVTGTVPMMPEWATGFWQSKMRYRSQEELLNIAREYKKRDIPLSVIVIDYFHWLHEGEWSFDSRYWPDIKSMTEELKEMGIKLMVSVWPTVERASENYKEMLEKGYLMKVERGVRYTMVFRNATIHYDPTRKEAREYLWNKIKENYYDKGIDCFWLDEAEPDLTAYDFDNYRYSTGSALQVGNTFCIDYAKTFYDGLTSCGETNVLSLIRCAWAGAQRYGSLLWSGDIDSTFESLRRQLAAGLNAGMAGIPWWTSDIGGFSHADVTTETWHQLFPRWFAFATFCPVMRLHGVRMPEEQPIRDKDGIHFEGTGSPNEVWSFGDDNYETCKKFIQIREHLKDYILENMKIAHETGDPVMRPLFYDFPYDSNCYTDEYETEFLFGPNILVAPILYENCFSRDVYLPIGDTWTDAWSNKAYEGGQTITVDAPLNQIPVFTRNGQTIK